MDRLLQLLNTFLKFSTISIRSSPYVISLQNCKVRIYEIFNTKVDDFVIAITVTNYSEEDGTCISEESTDGRFNYSEDELLEALNYHGYTIEDIINKVELDLLNNK
jgi:hypothetical protein